MVLSKSEINQRCRAIKPLIENMSDANVQACSYDLRMGNQYYYDDGDNNHQANVRTLGIGEYSKYLLMLFVTSLLKNWLTFLAI